MYTHTHKHQNIVFYSIASCCLFHRPNPVRGYNQTKRNALPTEDRIIT